MTSSTDAHGERGPLARLFPRRSRFVDLLLGVLLPSGLLLADPIVFKSFARGGETLHGELRAAAYVATLWFAAMLSWWLIARRGPAFFAGTLAAGCVLALAAGSALLPLSLSAIVSGALGLFDAGLFALVVGGVGLLGVTPFAVALVYASRTTEAWKVRTRGAAASLAAVIGFATPLLVAGAVQVQTTRSMARALEELRADDVDVRERGLARLRWLRWFGDPDSLRRAYDAEQDADKKQRLAEGFLAVTGVSIDEGID